MSNDQILRYYSDDQWWDHLPVDHHPDHMQNYQMNVTPLDHAGGSRHVSARPRLSTSAPDQYPETAATTTASVSPENLMKQPAVQTSPPKRKRRRGRGGAMATTTFLNSTITNFRELVQQHTGMGSTSTDAIASCCDQKGPFTLCFADYSSSSSTCESALGFHHHRNQY